MKTLFVIVFVAGTLSFVSSVSAQTRGTTDNAGVTASDAKNTGKGCAACAQKASADSVSTRLVPGTNETMLVGRVENLMPIGVVAVLVFQFQLQLRFGDAAAAAQPAVLPSYHVCLCEIDR